MAPASPPPRAPPTSRARLPRPRPSVGRSSGLLLRREGGARRDPRQRASGLAQRHPHRFRAPRELHVRVEADGVRALENVRRLLGRFRARAQRPRPPHGTAPPPIVPSRRSVNHGSPPPPACAQRPSRTSQGSPPSRRRLRIPDAPTHGRPETRTGAPLPRSRAPGG